MDGTKLGAKASGFAGSHELCTRVEVSIVAPSKTYIGFGIKNFVANIIIVVAAALNLEHVRGVRARLCDRDERVQSAPMVVRIGPSAI